MYYQNNQGGYGGYQQQPTQLPFDPTQQQQQFVNVSVGQPPFNPQINAPQQILPFVPLIASIAIMEIQNNVGKNPLRTFMFNLYARDGFNNREFHELIEICAKYCHMDLNNRGGNPEQLISAAVPDIVKMVAGGNIQHFQALQSFITPQDLELAIQNLNRLRGLITMIQNAERATQGYNQQGNRGGYSGGYSGGFGGGGQTAYSGSGYPGSGGGYASRAPGVPTGLFVSGNGSSGTGYGPVTNPPVGGNATGALENMERQLNEMRSGTGSSEEFVHPTQRQSNQGVIAAAGTPSVLADTKVGFGGISPVDSINRSIGSYQAPIPKMETVGSTYQPNTSQVEGTLDQVMTSLSITKEAPPKSGEVSFNAGDRIECNGEIVVLRNVGDLKWARSELQPYHPAWNNNTHKLFYTQLKNGSVIAIALKKTQEEIEKMDYDKHGVGGTPPVDYTSRPVVQEPGPVTDLPEPEKPKVVIFRRAAASLDDSASGAKFFSGMEARMGDHLSKPSSAYYADAFVMNPLFCDNKELAGLYRLYITRITQAKSFAEAQSILREMTHANTFQLRNYLDRALTQEVNRALAVNMSLDNVNIDSFMEDAVALDKALRESFNDQIANSLKQNEVKLIQGCIGSMNEENSFGFTTDMAGDIEKFAEWTGDVVYNVQRVSWTHVAQASYELNLSLVRNRGNLISEDTHPVMNALAEEILNHQDNKDFAFYRHYIVTSDGITMYLTNGFLNKNSKLLVLE